jgi:hypothetical protein
MLILNYDNVNSQLNDYKNINFTYKQYIQAIYNILLEDMNLYLNLSLILLLIFYEGLIGAILIFIHLFFIIFESKILSVRSWKISYVLFLCILGVKIFIRYKYDLV